MKKTFLFIFIVLCFNAHYHAQTAPSFQWAKSIGYGIGGPHYNDNFIRTDASGNIYTSGNYIGTMDFDPSPNRFDLITYSPHGFYLAKYDANGNFLWAKGFNDDLINYLRDMEIDAAGNIYLTGTFTDSLDMDPSPATFNIYGSGIVNGTTFFAKYNNAGNLVWVKTLQGIGPNSTSTSQSFSIKLDNNNNIFLGGLYTNMVDFDPSAAANTLTSTTTDFFVSKYDNAGNFLWVTGFASPAGNVIGKVLEVLSTGDIVIGGTFSGQSVDFDPTPATTTLSAVSGNDVFIVKTNTNGAFMWAKQYNSASGDALLDIASANNGEFLISGSSDLYGAGFIAKYDVNGNVIWDKNNIGNGFTRCSRMKLNANGDIFVTGNFKSVGDFDPSAIASATLTPYGNEDIFVAKYNSNGNYLWAYSYGSSSSDFGSDLAFDLNNDIITTGIFNCQVDFDASPAVHNLHGLSSSIFINKYTSLAGNYINAFSLENGTGGDDMAHAMSLDVNNDLVIAGMFKGAVDFDPSASTQMLISTGSFCFSNTEDVFFAKYTNQGNLIWAKTVGGGQLEDLEEVVTDNAGNVYIVGNFTGTMDLDPSASVASLTSYTNSGGEIYIAKYDSQGNYLWAKNFGGNLYTNAIDMAIDNNGNLYITGYLQGTVDFDPSPAIANLTSAGGPDIFIVAFNTNGNYLWAKNLGSYGWDSGTAIAIDNNSGSIYLSGSFSSTVDLDPSAAIANVSDVGNGDGFIAKYDLNGNYLWARSFGGPGSESSLNISIDASGNAILQGSYQYTASFDPPLNTFTLTKYDANGNVLWANSLNNCYNEAMALDASNNIYMIGGFNGTNDFDPGIGVSNLSSVDISDAYIAKYNSSGNYIYAVSFGGYGNVYPRALVIDAANNLYPTGGFNKRADLDPSLQTSNLISYAGFNSHIDVFIAGYYSCTTPPILTNTISGMITFVRVVP